MTRTIDGMDARLIETDRGGVFVQTAGSGPAVLLLHGFPETGLMWRDVARLLQEDFTVVVADLPGYGASQCPADEDDHASMSKRSMALTLAEVMSRLGCERFAVVGHDRGGRVAYRMALDYPDRVTHIVALDIVPTAEVWERADARLALAFWPFCLLAQPAPLPERMILGAADAVVDNALGGWGSPADMFPPDVRDAYIAALSDPAHVHAICEEYRAAASIDRDHDAVDRRAGKTIACPLLALWSGQGALAEWYSDAGGPMGLWRQWAELAAGEATDGGHFFPEEYPAETAQRIKAFLSD
ncbi:alpha/beta fold hydrolase [Devosia nitrariae]|nr:alpha/beta hydrolase [Devosia nitrariae]